MGAYNGFYGESEVELSYDDEGKRQSFHAMSAKDAYVLCMRKKGKVDLFYMEQISGINTDQLIEELSGIVIFPDPEVYEATNSYEKCFVSRQQYLRGNLIRKLEIARLINEKIGLFDATVTLLEENIPDQVDPEDIHVNLGSTWIPVRYISSFVQELLGLAGAPRVEYNEYLGKWTIQTLFEPAFMMNHTQYGTIRMSAIQIIKYILNAKPVKVFDQVSKRDGKYGYDNVLNENETLAAQQKEKLIIEKWQAYLRENREIWQHLQELYMESYGYAMCRYDGSFLDLPGLNPDIKPYEHQKNAIARVMLSSNTLLAHEVGAGKTLEFSCGVHELIRIGQGSKAMIVVPNNTFEAAVNAYKNAYPQDEILAVYPKKDFTPRVRRKTLEKIASDEYHVIFMAYSSFDMLTMSSEYLLDKREEKIAECRAQIDLVKASATRCALEAELKRQKKAYNKYREELKDTMTSCFDKLGIDILVVDEAHNYKNITLDYSADNIVGVHNKGSRKADNLLQKVEYIQGIDGHVIFATGTPITNSLADLYVLQRYLQPNELKLCNIYHFNDWINTFCSQTHTFEIDVDSKNFRFTTRFSMFHNLPELMSLFSDVCDYYQIENSELGLPEFDGYTDVVVKKLFEQKEFIDWLAERTEKIRAREVSRSEDNLLLITVEGRKCALEIRLVLPETDVTGRETKVGVCADNVTRVYNEYPGTTQIVYCDISTPKDGFNIYDELKKELIYRGVPADEIMFIHEAKTEAQRSKIEKLFNAGKIRVLIGSTMKLGTGCNVQERLLAVHHLDVPWRPADMVQREGRIIRQGNTNEKVYVFRYVTEGSFDAYTWQILENKQRFIAQFLSGSLSGVHRDESDCADTVLSRAEIKALAIGNPLIKERVEVSNELEHARINQKQKRKELVRLKDLINSYPAQIEKRKIMIRNARYDHTNYKARKQVVTMEERISFGEELLYALAKNTMRDKDRRFCHYQGFAVILPRRMKPEKPYVILQRQNSNRYTVKMDGDKALGCSKRLDYFLEHLGDTVAFHENKLREMQLELKNAKESYAKGNEFNMEVESLVRKLSMIDKKLEKGESS